VITRLSPVQRTVEKTWMSCTTPSTPAAARKSPFFPHGRSGAVVVAQRFGSALNLNLHFHALVLDGVYASPDPFTRPVFHPASPPTRFSIGTSTFSKITSLDSV